VDRPKPLSPGQLLTRLDSPYTKRQYELSTTTAPPPGCLPVWADYRHQRKTKLSLTYLVVWRYEVNLTARLNTARDSTRCRVCLLAIMPLNFNLSSRRCMIHGIKGYHKLFQLPSRLSFTASAKCLDASKS
jgi:hypothetical protein